MVDPPNDAFPKLSLDVPSGDGCLGLQGPAAGPFTHVFLVHAKTLPHTSGQHLPWVWEALFGGGESPSQAHLDLPGANVKLLQDVDEEVLNLHPGVDAVGTIQDNDDVHVSLAPWGVRTWSQLPQEPVSENLWFPA